MKKSIVTLVGVVIVMFLINLHAYAQSLHEGSVTFLLVLPDPGSPDYIYDFNLCCGQEGTGQGGHLPDGFGYAGGIFTLQYTVRESGFREELGLLDLLWPERKEVEGDAYSLTGNIVSWAPVERISAACVTQSAHLINISITVNDGSPVTGLVGDYSQFYCVTGNVIWLGPGGLTVHD